MFCIMCFFFLLPADSFHSSNCYYIPGASEKVLGPWDVKSKQSVLVCVKRVMKISLLAQGYVSL